MWFCSCPSSQRAGPSSVSTDPTPPGTAPLRTHFPPVHACPGPEAATFHPPHARQTLDGGPQARGSSGPSELPATAADASRCLLTGQRLLHGPHPSMEASPGPPSPVTFHIHQLLGGGGPRGGGGSCVAGARDGSRAAVRTMAFSPQNRVDFSLPLFVQRACWCLIRRGFAKPSQRAA